MSACDTTHILLPLIDPEHEKAAFSVARGLAAAFKAELHLLAPGSPAPPQELARRLSVPPEALDGVAIEQASGDMVEAITRRIADLRQAIVVLAVRLGGEAPRNEVPEIERRLLKEVLCSLLVVPPDRDMSGWRLRRELLPQDGTPRCAAALARVINRTRQSGVENLVVRVAGAKVDQPTEPGSLALPRYVDHPQYDWEAWGQEFLDRICETGVNLDEAGLRLLVATGEPAADILRLAEEEAVDMIILPWHGALGSGRAPMIKAVLHGASCPVLLLPERGDDRCADVS